MLEDWSAVLIIFTALEHLAGLTLNTCILAVNFKEWRKGARLQQCDQIHMAMAIANILLQWVVTACLSTSWLSFNDLIWASLLTVAILSLIYFSFWLNAWLCMYYVTSIAKRPNSFFIWLKIRIVRTLPKLILVSAVGSFAISLPSIWNIYIETQVANMNRTINSTATIPTSANRSYLLTVTSLGCFLPFTLSTLCIGHTLTSLLRHIWRVKHNDSGFSRPSLQAHVRAVRTMVLLLMLYTCLYLTQTLGFISSRTIEDPLPILSWFVTLFFPTAEAFILIQANAKLRKVFQGKCFKGLHSAKVCCRRNM